jgi:hypothetical protein
MHLYKPHVERPIAIDKRFLAKKGPVARADEALVAGVWKGRPWTGRRYSTTKSRAAVATSVRCAARSAGALADRRKCRSVRECDDFALSRIAMRGSGVMLGPRYSMTFEENTGADRDFSRSLFIGTTK